MKFGDYYVQDDDIDEEFDPYEGLSEEEIR